MQTVLTYDPKNSQTADGGEYYGFHRVRHGWVYREYVPGAKTVFLAGEFNNWDWTSHPMMNLGGGKWSLFLFDEKTLWEECKVKIQVDGVESLPYHSWRSGAEHG